MTVTVEDAKVFQEKKLVEFGVSDVIVPIPKGKSFEGGDLGGIPSD